MNKLRPIHGGYPTPPKSYRPWVLMSVSEIVQNDCDAINKLVGAGCDVVVVQDENFEQSLSILKKARTP